MARCGFVPGPVPGSFLVRPLAPAAGVPPTAGALSDGSAPARWVAFHALRADSASLHWHALGLRTRSVTACAWLHAAQCAPGGAMRHAVCQAADVNSAWQTGQLEFLRLREECTELRAAWATYQEQPRSCAERGVFVARLRAHRRELHAWRQRRLWPSAS